VLVLEDAGVDTAAKKDAFSARRGPHSFRQGGAAVLRYGFRNERLNEVGSTGASRVECTHGRDA